MLVLEYKKIDDHKLMCKVFIRVPDELLIIQTSIKHWINASKHYDKDRKIVIEHWIVKPIVEPEIPC